MTSKVTPGGGKQTRNSHHSRQQDLFAAWTYNEDISDSWWNWPSTSPQRGGKSPCPPPHPSYDFNPFPVPEPPLPPPQGTAQGAAAFDFFPPPPVGWMDWYPFMSHSAPCELMPPEGGYYDRYPTPRGYPPPRLPHTMYETPPHHTHHHPLCPLGGASLCQYHHIKALQDLHRAHDHYLPHGWDRGGRSSRRTPRDKSHRPVDTVVGYFCERLLLRPYRSGSAHHADKQAQECVTAFRAIVEKIQEKADRGEEMALEELQKDCHEFSGTWARYAHWLNPKILSSYCRRVQGIRWTGKLENVQGPNRHQQMPELEEPDEEHHVLSSPTAEMEEVVHNVLNESAETRGSKVVDASKDLPDPQPAYKE
eukprot:Sspe_Gene.30236::Locus_14874_Transcript_1_10_Confidence_0.118_Length_1379::g.30236::m.30236